MSTNYLDTERRFINDWRMAYEQDRSFWQAYYAKAIDVRFPNQWRSFRRGVYACSKLAAKLNAGSKVPCNGAQSWRGLP